MSKCTDPGRWPAVPGYETSEEDVARYLAHLSECAFHAAIEQREEDHLGTAVALAISAPDSQSGPVPEQDAAMLRQGREMLDAMHRHVLIRTLSIRVNGSERARLDLLEESCITLELEEGTLIGIWQSEESNRAGDLYLTSYVLPVHRAPSGEKTVIATVLEGGQRISFAVEPRGDSRAQLTVAYAETAVLPGLRLSFARLKHGLGHGALERRWISTLGLTVALLALLAALVLFPLLWSRTEKPTQIANRGDKPQQGEVPTPTEPHQPSPSLDHTPNANAEGPNAPPKRQPSPVPNAPSQISLVAVRRVYVGKSAGDDRQQLRAALVSQLQAGGKFIVVNSEQEADAVLVSEPTRSAGVNVQLLNRAGKPLWFTTQSTSLQDVGDVAGRIVKALTDEAEKRRRENLPRP